MTQTIKKAGFLFSFVLFYSLLFSQQMDILTLYRMAPVNYLGFKHQINRQGDKYVGVTEGGEGVNYTVNLVTNRMESTQEYFRDSHLGVTTFAAKQTDKKGNIYLVIYFDKVTGGTGVKSSEIKAFQYNRGKWLDRTSSVIPVIEISQFMKTGFDKKLLKKLSGASGIFIKEYKIPLKTPEYIAVFLTATWLPSQVNPPQHEIIEKISQQIKYSFILKWDKNKGQFSIVKKVEKDELDSTLESLN